MMRVHRRGSTSDSGFTIVEIVIAMLLLTVVVSGVTLALASGSKLEQSRDLNSRMTAASERVYEHLRSNKDWIRDCRRASATAEPKTCHPFEQLSDDERRKLASDDILDVRFTITTSAVGIDNSGDLLAGADRDGNVDDFFQLTLKIEVPPGDVARLGNHRAMVVTSIINGSTNSESGALVLTFCGADNQVDERIQIASCPNSPTWFEMPDCAGTPNCAPRSQLPSTPPGSTMTPSRFVAMLPLDPPKPSIRLVKRGGEDSGRTYDGTASVRVRAGVYRFADLPTGTYEVQSYTLAGWVDWSTHHIPSSKAATVERQRTAQALIALRRPGASDDFKMKFDRTVVERFIGARDKTFETPWIPECEEPSSVNRTAFGTRTATCSAPHLVVTWKGGGSMTATMEGLNNMATRYDSDGHYKEIVTVKYITRVDKKDYVWNGAAESSTFSTQPEPAGRYTERTRNGAGATYSIPADRWKQRITEAPHYPSPSSNTTANGIGTGSIDDIPVGLGDGMKARTSSKIGNVFQRYYPASCDRNMMWARPDGSFGSCSSLHFRGNDGECYQTLGRNWTGYSYYRHDGCNGIYWPPVGMVTRPGYLIVQVCTRRLSRVSNIVEQSVDGFENISGGYSREDWIDYQRSVGRQVYESGSHMGVSGLRTYRRETSGTQTREVWNRCQSSPTPQAPIVCAALNDWTNCSSSLTVTIPRTPGWGTSSNVEDGHRPNNSGASMTALSG
jgi:type II secretory pathway pseudopilin PulG